MRLIQKRRGWISLSLVWPNVPSLVNVTTLALYNIAYPSWETSWSIMGNMNWLKSKIPGIPTFYPLSHINFCISIEHTIFWVTTYHYLFWNNTQTLWWMRYTSLGLSATTIFHLSRTIQCLILSRRHSSIWNTIPFGRLWGWISIKKVRS